MGMEYRPWNRSSKTRVRLFRDDARRALTHELFCRNLRPLRSLPSKPFLMIKAPMITSLCPFRYLLIDWRTISAPRSKGLLQYGERKVLSTTINGRSCSGIERTIEEMSSRGGTTKRGLVGDSSQINLVRGVSAEERSCGEIWAISRKSTSTDVVASATRFRYR